MKPPPPPSPDMNGSTTPSAAPTATAPSTALPPSNRTRRPAVAARPCAAATTPLRPTAGSRAPRGCAPLPSLGGGGAFCRTPLGVAAPRRSRGGLLPPHLAQHAH